MFRKLKIFNTKSPYGVERKSGINRNLNVKPMLILKKIGCKSFNCFKVCFCHKTNCGACIINNIKQLNNIVIFNYMTNLSFPRTQSTLVSIPGP